MPVRPGYPSERRLRPELPTDRPLWPSRQGMSAIGTEAPRSSNRLLSTRRVGSSLESPQQRATYLPAVGSVGAMATPVVAVSAAITMAAATVTMATVTIWHDHAAGQEESGEDRH